MAVLDSTCRHCLPRSTCPCLCLLSPGSCQYHFKLTNHGQRTQRLYWRTDGSLASAQSSKGGNLPGRTILPPIFTPKKKDSLGSVHSSREKPVFSLIPSRVELFPGCSVDMVLTASSDSPKVRRCACSQKVLQHSYVAQWVCVHLIWCMFYCVQTIESVLASGSTGAFDVPGHCGLPEFLRPHYVCRCDLPICGYYAKHFPQAAELQHEKGWSKDHERYSVRYVFNDLVLLGRAVLPYIMSSQMFGFAGTQV